MHICNRHLSGGKQTRYPDRGVHLRCDRACFGSPL